MVLGALISSACNQGTNMPTVVKREGPRGVAYLARARVYGRSPVSRTFDTRAEAKEWAREQEAAMRRQKERKAPDGAKLTIGRLIGNPADQDPCGYLQEPNVKAKRSLAEKERLLAWWINKHGDKLVRECGATFWRECRKELDTEIVGVGKRRGTRDKQTVNRYLSEMRAAWNWGRSVELVRIDHLWPPKILHKEPKGRRRYLSIEEARRLLDAAKPDPLMQAAILTSVSTGMRQSEMLRLEWRDINLDTGNVIILESKTDEPRANKLLDIAVDALKLLRKQPVTSTRWLFLNSHGKHMSRSCFDKRWRKALRASKLEDFRWHDLRHSAASFRAQAGASLPQIGGMLGHMTPQTTQRYAHLIPGVALQGDSKLNEELKK